MAEKKYPHEILLEEANGAFSTKDLPSDLQSQIKVFNMHKGRKDAKENEIKSLAIAQEIDKWMTENNFIVEEIEEGTPAASNASATPSGLTAEELKAQVKAELAAEKAEAEKAEKEAAEKAAAEKAAAEQAAKEVADKEAAEKAAKEAADKAAADAAAEAAAAEAARLALEEKKKDPHYGKKFVPMVGWIPE